VGQCRTYYRNFPHCTVPENSLPCAKSPALVLILSQINPVQALSACLIKIDFNITLPPTRRSTKWSLSFRFPHQNPVRISVLSQTYHSNSTAVPSDLSHTPPPTQLWQTLHVHTSTVLRHRLSQQHASLLATVFVTALWHRQLLWHGGQAGSPDYKELSETICLEQSRKIFCVFGGILRLSLLSVRVLCRTVCWARWIQCKPYAFNVCF
jgi:hypothetical protein